MVPGTFTQIYLQFVIAVKFREARLTANHQKEVFSFIAGLINSMGHKSFAVNGMSDHVHILVSFSPYHSPSETIKEIKRVSTNFINEKGWFGRKFQWQNGYGCFSYSRSQIDDVMKYILNQQTHHAKRSFREEYLEFLHRFEVEYNEHFFLNFLMNENRTRTGFRYAVMRWFLLKSNPYRIHIRIANPIFGLSNAVRIGL